MICLGLDIGSTTVKGAVLDVARREVRSIVKEAFPQPVSGLPAGYFEVSASEIQTVVESVISRLLTEAPDAEAVWCSGQMGGVVLVDETGKALTNYLSWRDQRTLQIDSQGKTALDHLRETWKGSELADLGRELQPGSASSLLYWLEKHKQLPDRVVPATVADYVLGRLCGVSPQMHPTQAIGLLDLRSGTWHQAAFDALGLGQVQWPHIADEHTPIGTAKINGKSLRCYASFGDQQCALRGVGLTCDELSLNISTGSQVSRRTNRFEPGDYQTRCYFGGDLINTITHIPAGRSLNVLFDLLTELAGAEGITLQQPWETIAQRTATANGGGLQADLSFFAGPFGSRGLLEGITTENLSVGNLFYAAFETMAENYLKCADRLCPQRTGLALALSGGLTRSMPILRKLIQDRFENPIRESTDAEETLTGLLKIAEGLAS